MADPTLESYTSRARLEPFTESDQPSAFSDTVSAAFALTRREEISSSALSAWSKAVDARAKVIGQLGGDEQLARRYQYVPQITTRNFRQLEQDGRLEDDAVYQAERRGAMGDSYSYTRDFERRYPGQVKTDEELMEAIKADYAQQRERDEAVIDRGGGFASFLGTAGGVMTDPLVLATLPFGGEGVAGRGIFGTALKAGAKEGAVAMATELPIQAQVYQFKREIESPWSFKDSAVNVLSAGVGGAVIGGTLAGGVEGTRRALASYRERVAAGTQRATEETEAAAAQLEDALPTLEQNPLGTDELAEDVHLQALERARAQIEDQQPVDVAPTVQIVETPDGLAQVAPRAADPTQLVDIDPTSLQVDARTFQFKAGGDTEGVTGALQGVQRFDRRLAGVALVWERADGQQFIADGHQRVNLARRAIAAGQDPAEVRLNGFVLREADGVTAADARRIAAAKNMAEGTGSALDAAKILRAVGPAGEAALPPLPPRSALVRQARGLAQLDDEAFLQVVNGVVDERFGALVGAATDDGNLQAAMIQVLKRAQPANELQARAIVDQVRTQGVETRTTEDLFGEASFSESRYLERAQVLDEALKLMRQDRAVFGGLVSNQERIGQVAGNRLDREGNLARQQEAADVATQISIRANAVGPLSDALQQAANAVAGGASPASAARGFLKAARSEILHGDTGGRGARPAGRPGEAPGAVRVNNPVSVAGLPKAEQRAAVEAFKAKQAGQSLEELYQVAEGHQAKLGAAADRIAQDMGPGVEAVNPGVKARAGSEEKLVRKGAKDAGALTDVVRVGFKVATPEQSAEVLRRLGAQFELLDEGVVATDLGYVDHKALVRFPDGRVGEVQLWDPAIAEAKFGEGHALYEQARVLTAEQLATPEGRALDASIAQASQDLYTAALVKASPEWRKIAMQALPESQRESLQAAVEAAGTSVGGGRGGTLGKVSKNSPSPMRDPESITTTAETRDQAPAPSGTKKASSPGGVSRTTAGKPSQLKNRSAIDAPPRSIIQRVDDPHSAQPEASRTGTVADEDYEAVMSQFAALQEDLGAQLKVTSVVDGVPIERQASAVLEELDSLEESLERIRVCSTPARSAA